MDNVIAQFAADDTITYYTSDSVKQSRMAKLMTEFDDKIGFIVEPGETVIIPIKPFEANHTTIVNTKNSVESGMTIVYPQMAHGEVTEIAMKNTSRIGVVIASRTEIASTDHLPKQPTTRGAKAE